MRKALPDQEARSARIWDRVRALPVVERAATLLVYDTIPGEPDTAPFIEWCRSVRKVVAAPEDDVEPSWPDVVIVPGLAFTRAGDRIGQGGGWYDRFLAQTRDNCISVGVCFAPQIVDVVPTEPHDVVVDIVISD
jgi:5-formyltetrahydrofolate cyclo-ligase